MWKCNLLDFFYNTPVLLVPPSPYSVHISTPCRNIMHFVLQGHCLAQSLQILSLAAFQLYDTKVLLFFLHAFYQCTSKKSLVYIDQILHHAWFQTKHFFKWNLYAAKMLLLTLKTITFKYWIKKFSFLASDSIFNRSLSFSRSSFSFSTVRFLLVSFFFGVGLETSTVLAAQLFLFKIRCIGVSWLASISSTKFFSDDNLFLRIFDIPFLNTCT